MLTELKREAYEANLQLPRQGLVNLNFGNASALDRGRGILAIKPSGVDYGKLKPSDMVLVDLRGRTIEGRLRPSSDTPTHLELYRGFPRIGGIVHTHSFYATAFAQAGREIPVLGTTHSDFFLGAVPVTRPHPAPDRRPLRGRDGQGDPQALCPAGPKGNPRRPRAAPRPVRMGRNGGRGGRVRGGRRALRQARVPHAFPGPGGDEDHRGPCEQALPAQARPRGHLRPEIDLISAAGWKDSGPPEFQWVVSKINWG